jgi:hypothetical protein
MATLPDIRSTPDGACQPNAMPSVAKETAATLTILRVCCFGMLSKAPVDTGILSSLPGLF